MPSSGWLPAVERKLGATWDPQKRLVFQGVPMLFDAKFDREWKDGENRTNTLVFIGKNLDRAALTEGFKACLS
jgi:G3E family GTPase